MLYLLLQPVAKVVLLVNFKMTTIGSKQLPNGPLILATNHHSNYDPIILGGTFKRRIYFLAKAELFTHPFASWFMRKIHAIPVDRKSGIVIRPVRHVLKIIGDGHILGIFPEGKRCKAGEWVRPKKGVAYFSSKTRAPIIPIAITRGPKGWWRTPITLMIGEPIDASPFSDSDHEPLSLLV